MAQLIRNMALLAVLAGGLAACGDDNDQPAPPPPPPPVVVVPPPVAGVEDGFGANFATAYRNNPNTDATDPAPGDVPALSLTTEAVVI